MQVKCQPQEIIIKIKRKRNNSSLIQLSIFLPLAQKCRNIFCFFLINIFYTFLQYSDNKSYVAEDGSSFIENRCFTVHVFWLSLTYSHSIFTTQIHFPFCCPTWSLWAISIGISYMKSRKGEHTIFLTKKKYILKGFHNHFPVLLQDYEQFVYTLLQLMQLTNTNILKCF